MILLRLIFAVCLVLWAGMAAAQVGSLDSLTGQGGDTTETEESAEAEEEPPSDPVPPPEPGALNEALPLYDEWNAIARRVEEALVRGNASAFTLGNFWDEVFDWRDRFESITSENAGRLSTLNAQIAALTTPEEEEPPEIVAARLSELTEERDTIRAPQLLAQEAFARADGLILEIDAQLRAEDFSDLTSRAPTPLNPMLWPDAFVHLGDVVSGLYSGGIAALTGASHSDNTVDRLPVVAGIVIAGLALLTLGHNLFERWDSLANEENYRTNLLWRFLSDMLALLMPIIGVFLVVAGIELLQLFTPYLENVLMACVPAGMTAIATRWLSQRFFPTGERMGPLHYYREYRGKLRRVSLSLGLTIAAGILWSTVIEVGEMEEGTRLVLLLPIHLLSGLLLFRFGNLIRQPPDDEDPDTPRSVPRTRSIVGRGIMLVGIVAPLLAVLGFGNATQALIVPAVQTLAVLGVVILAQKLVNDIAMRNRVRDSEDAGPLAPLLIGVLFFALALPILALIWGASGADLLQYWARFRSGFVLGETRYSPGDFMTLLIVFLVGFLLTRFIQGTLRNSVLPRTKLDLGGQNAVVTGFGYIGITIAALVGVTTAGIDLSNLAIVAGALSVGIGFGLQTVVSNFVSGIILLIERPISEGELIEINGQLGYVRDISVRSTRIETFDRKDVIIPNADLVSEQVINWTRGNLVGRAIVSVGVAYGSDVERVKEIMKEVAMENPMVLHNPPPGVLFMGFGDSSLDFEVRAILRDVNFIMEVKSEVGLEIARRFHEEGIHIPFPQRDIWMRQTQDPSEEPST